MLPHPMLRADADLEDSAPPPDPVLPDPRTHGPTTGRAPHPAPPEGDVRPGVPDPPGAGGTGSHPGAAPHGRDRGEDPLRDTAAAGPRCGFSAPCSRLGRAGGDALNPTARTRPRRPGQSASASPKRPANRDSPTGTSLTVGARRLAPADPRPAPWTAPRAERIDRIDRIDRSGFSLASLLSPGRVGPSSPLLDTQPSLVYPHPRFLARP